MSAKAVETDVACGHMLKDTCADWVARNIRSSIGNTVIGDVSPVFTEGQRRCIETLAAIDRPYNLQLAGESSAERWNFHGDHLNVCYLGCISTFDCDRLTRLVVAAHKNHVRVEVAPRMATVEGENWDEDEHAYETYELPAIWISLTARSPNGSNWERHPGVERLTELAVA